MITALTLHRIIFQSDGTLLEILFWGALLAGAAYAVFYTSIFAYAIIRFFIKTLLEFREWLNDELEKSKRLRR